MDTYETRKSPGCLLQLLWFFFIGIWLGQIWIIVAWIMMITIIGIPVGVSMLNMVPKVIALREPDRKLRFQRNPDGSVSASEVRVPQVNIILRALYFILIGWWFSALWMETAYIFTATIILLPVGFWMFDRVPLVLSLHQD